MLRKAHSCTGSLEVQASFFFFHPALMQLCHGLYRFVCNTFREFANEVERAAFAIHRLLEEGEFCDEIMRQKGCRRRGWEP